MLTVEKVRAEVERIREMAGDDEAAHAAEDRLYTRVLREIADGTSENPAAVARAALEAETVDFQRWCA